MLNSLSSERNWDDFEVGNTIHVKPCNTCKLPFASISKYALDCRKCFEKRMKHRNEEEGIIKIC